MVNHQLQYGHVFLNGVLQILLFLVVVLLVSHALGELGHQLLVLAAHLDYLRLEVDRRLRLQALCDLLHLVVLEHLRHVSV